MLWNFFGKITRKYDMVNLTIIGGVKMIEAIEDSRTEFKIKLVDDIFDEKPAGIIALSNDMEQVDTDLLLGQKNRHNRYSFPNMTKGTKTEDTFDLKPLSSN